MQASAVPSCCSPPPAALVGGPAELDDPRTRLRERVAQAGPEGATDRDLLEHLLLRSVPPRQVACVADRLLARHGDLGSVLAAPIEALAKAVGPATASDLKIAETVAHRLLRARIDQRPVVSGWDALVAYCRATLGRARTERLRVLFLDTKNVLIADEEHGRGTIDHVPAYPREILRRALELNAKALILVHNHPSGDPTPSRSDLDLTHQVREACALFDLIFHDHVIVGRDTVLSLRAGGHL